MSAQPDPNSELKAVEAVLGSLAPAAGRLDRDRVLYEAGRASVRARSIGRTGWPALAGILTILAVSEAVVLARRPSVRYVERVVVVRETAPAASAFGVPAPEPERPLVIDAETPTLRLPFLALSGAETDFQRLRSQMLRYGIDGLPEPPTVAPRGNGLAAGREDQPASDLLRSEVDAILNPGDPS